MSAVVAGARVTRISAPPGETVYRVTRWERTNRCLRSGTVGFVRRSGRDWSHRLFDEAQWFGRSRTRKDAVVELLAHHALEVAS